MDKLRMHTADRARQNYEKLAALFPAAVTEVITGYDEEGRAIVARAIDADVLRQEINTEVVQGPEERYQLTWPDKRRCMQQGNAPAAITLRPCREESVDFDTTGNLYIEGDNLDVLRLLQETYLNSVKAIYIDPPYNNGNDYLYKNDFAEQAGEYLPRSGQFDEQGNRLVQNTERNGRFHTDWLNMIYPRLRLAKDLLREDGVIFISIDDNEVHNLRKVCDEIFGPANFVECVVWNKRIPKNDNKGIGNIHENVLIYLKSVEHQRQFTMKKDGLEEIYDFLDGLRREGAPLAEAEQRLKQFYRRKGFDRGITLYCNLDEDYEPWGKINMSWPNGDTFGPRYEVPHPASGRPVKVPDRGWRWNQATFTREMGAAPPQQRFDGSYVCGGIWFAPDENTQPSSIRYLRDVDRMLLRSIISLKSDGGMEVEKLFDGKSIFPHPKSVYLLETLLSSLESSDGLVLDFFSGSATTAHAVMKMNAADGGTRRYVLVQLPEETAENSPARKAGYQTICDIGKERIRRAAKKLAAEHPEAVFDGGFRVLKLDSTNMEDVYYTPEAFGNVSTDELVENIKKDRSGEDLLFQVMLELGLPLSAAIARQNMAGRAVYSVNGGELIACFESGIGEGVVEEIAKQKPRYAIFRDNGIASDDVAANFDQIFAAHSPATVRRVL